MKKPLLGKSFMSKLYSKGKNIWIRGYVLLCLLNYAFRFTVVEKLLESGDVKQLRTLLPIKRNLVEMERRTNAQYNWNGGKKNESYHSLESILSSMKNNNSNTSDISFLLQFGILGFAKCGTSTMMRWLGSHDLEIQSYHDEITELSKNDPVGFVTKIHKLYLLGSQFQRGYKAPLDITYPHVHKHIRNLFPQMKLIVGVRHPVLWFESMYNYRINEPLQRFGLRDPNTLIGTCTKEMLNCCTATANFGSFFIQLGKHFGNLLGKQRKSLLELENRILNRYPNKKLNASAIVPLNNPLFLFEISQLKDKDFNRSMQFGNDIENFLDLQYPLPRIPRENVMIDSKRALDICDDKFTPLRQELMSIGIDSSTWITQVFLKSKTVFVSSPAYFTELVSKWAEDPCIERLKKQIS